MKTAAKADPLYINIFKIDVPTKKGNNKYLWRRSLFSEVPSCKPLVYFSFPRISMLTKMSTSGITRSAEAAIWNVLWKKLLQLQRRCFPVNIAKFLGTSILKKICERLLLVVAASFSMHLSSQITLTGCFFLFNE